MYHGFSRDRTLTLAVVLLAVLVVVLIASAIPLRGEIRAGLLQSPLLALLAAAPALALLPALPDRWRAGDAGFCFTHAAILLVLAGSLMNRIAGQAADIRLPPGHPGPIEQFVGTDGGWIRPGFGLSLLAVAPPPVDSARVRLQADRRDTVEAALVVNRPISRNGWRLFLMGGTADTGVVLLLRREPGRWLILAGLWLLVPGTVLLCWRKRQALDAP